MAGKRSFVAQMIDGVNQAKAEEQLVAKHAFAAKLVIVVVSLPVCSVCACLVVFRRRATRRLDRTKTFERRPARLLQSR